MSWLWGAHIKATVFSWPLTLPKRLTCSTSNVIYIWRSKITATRAQLTLQVDFDTQYMNLSTLTKATACTSAKMTTTKTPTVLLVPGFWEGPSVLQPLSAALTRAGITVQTAALRSTGHAAPSALARPADIDSSRKYTFGDDTAGVREAIRTAVEGAGDAGVVLFLHSVGGVVGCNATEGLDFGAWGRRGNGEGGGGGVRKIVFCAAGVAPVGFDGFGGPFAVEHVSSFLSSLLCD